MIGGASSRDFQTAAADVHRWAAAFLSPPPSSAVHCMPVYPPAAGGALGACQSLALHDRLCNLQPAVLQRFSHANEAHHQTSPLRQPAFTVHHAAHRSDLTAPPGQYDF